MAISKKDIQIEKDEDGAFVATCPNCSYQSGPRKKERSALMAVIGHYTKEHGGKVRKRKYTKRVQKFSAKSQPAKNSKFNLRVCPHCGLDLEKLQIAMDVINNA